MTLQKKPPRIILYEGDQSQPLSDELRFDIFQTLLKQGYRVTNWQRQSNVTSPDDTPLLVLGRFEDGKPPTSRIEDSVQLIFKDISQFDSAAVAALVADVTEELQTHKPGEWKPWFPVIDYDRCTNCMQCLSFCLFDVYGVSDADQIEVRNQSNCKTDCPACSRVCPEVAILFPKYRQGPINGDEVKTEDIEREKMKVDISSLLGGDIYQLLRDRSERAKSRFSKERDDERALKERKRCLLKLKEDLDIPDEVIMSLPSSDQIEKKAAQARGIQNSKQRS